VPSFSIILPAYNAESFLRQTLDSILAQTYADFEIVLIDDGSRDQTAAIAEGLDPRIRVFRQANAGIANARNRGIAEARGDWIAFMDHDDLWHPQKLAAQAQLLQSRPECGIVYGDYLRWDPATAPTFPDADLDTTRIAEDLSGLILHRMVEFNWVLLSTAVIRRQVFATVGLFDPTMPPADDWDFSIRASVRFPFVKMAQPVTLYRVHANQTSLKLPPVNFDFLLRKQALVRLRLAGGSTYNFSDVRHRQFRALFNYGLVQFKSGSYAASLRTFVHAWFYRLRSGKTLAFAAAALIRSMLPSRR
jgi:glycosyltransferase involved in cell wall biosynthesis